MRILSRKKLEFRTDDEGSAVTVAPLVFTEVPESAKLDPLFGWALRDGSIEVIETVVQQKELENEPNLNMFSQVQSVTDEVAEIPTPKKK